MRRGRSGEEGGRERRNVKLISLKEEEEGAEEGNRKEHKKREQKIEKEVREEKKPGPSEEERPASSRIR